MVTFIVVQIVAVTAANNLQKVFLYGLLICGDIIILTLQQVAKSGPSCVIIIMRV